MTAAPNPGLRIAVSGAHDLVAGAVLRLLYERDFPVAEVRALSDLADQLGTGETEDMAEAGGEAADRAQAPQWGDHALTLEPTQSADLGGVDLLFLCPPCADPQGLLERAVEAGARVIDILGVEREFAEDGLVAPDLEADAATTWGLQPHSMARVFRSPDPLALVMATVLLPLAREAGLEEIRAHCLLPAATFGEAGVRELAGQAENLFNQRDLPTVLYGRQIAFNLLAGPSLAAASTRDMLRDLAALLGDFDAPTDVRATWTPVFFGTAILLWVDTREPLAGGRVREILRAAPGVLLEEDAAAVATAPDADPERAGEAGDEAVARVLSRWPNPVEHALDSDAIHVAVLGDDQASRRGQVLWIVADEIRRGQALNAVRIAEQLQREEAPD